MTDTHLPIAVTHRPDRESLFKRGVFDWALWSKGVSTFPRRYDEPVTCYFLDGEVEVTPQHGAPVRIGRGDLVTFPKGLSCTWRVASATRMHYRIGD